MNIISKLLDLFDPTSWLFRGVAALVVAGAMWWAWTGFKAWVSAPAVAAALKTERAKTEPIFKELTVSFNTLKSTFDNITAASNAEARRQKNQLEIKQKGYDYAIANTKKLKAELDAMRGSDADFERLLNASAANNSARQASQSDRYERLEAAYQQCERDIRYAAETAAGTLEGFSAAVAAIEALKN